MIEPPIELHQDMHVHSTFSGGESTVAENVEEAERQGLRDLTCVERVEESTDWVPDFVAEVGDVRAGSDVNLLAGIEASLLDASGRLALPASGHEAAERIYVAADRVPLADGARGPDEVRASIAAGELEARAVIEAIVTATANAIGEYENVVIAHLFSILPRLELGEHDVPSALCEQLAAAAASGNAWIEINERTLSPSPAVLQPFSKHRVPILLGTGSRGRETIGRYRYCYEVVRRMKEGDTLTYAVVPPPRGQY